MSTPVRLSAKDVQAMLDASPYIAALGLRVEEADVVAHRLRLHLPASAAHRRAAGTQQVHGGVIAALIDIAGDYAVALALGGPVPTINFRTDYLRPAEDSDLWADAVCRRAGRTVSVADVDVIDADGRTVAIGRGTYASLPRR
jgi:uncharacterized protein (TIGR00369 family)